MWGRVLGPMLGPMWGQFHSLVKYRRTLSYSITIYKNMRSMILVFTLYYTNVSIAKQITLKFLLYIDVGYLYSNHFTSPGKYLYFNTNV